MTRTRTSCSCAGLIGLVRQLAKVTPLQAGLSGRTPMEVSSTSGKFMALGSWRIFFASINPSMSGICMSRIATSNASPWRSHFEGLGAAVRGAWNHPPLAGLQGENPPVGGIVIDNKQAQVCQLGLGILDGGLRGLGGLGGGLERQHKMKDRALLRRALHPHPAAHEFRSRLLMASPSPLPPYWRVVEASAWLKDLKSRVQPRGMDADAGVADGKEHLAGRGRGRGRRGSRPALPDHRALKPPAAGFTLHHHLAFRGKLDAALLQEVDENLPEAGGRRPGCRAGISSSNW